MMISKQQETIKANTSTARAIHHSHETKTIMITSELTY